mgnify:CR=1 FL=1
MTEDYNEYALSKKERASFAAGFVSFLCLPGYVFYESLLPAAAGLFAYRKEERFYRNYKAGCRKNALLLQFRDFLYSLSSSFATGRHMTEAIQEAGENLREIYGENSDMAAETESMLRRIRETGATDLEVLADFSARSHLEEAEDFTQVFRACRETGGNLVAAVNKAATVIGEKINIEREIKTMVAQKKLEGRIITAMPAVIIFFLQLMSADYLDVMYQTLAGRILMSAALGLTLGASIVIERITEIEV